MLFLLLILNMILIYNLNRNRICFDDIKKWEQGTAYGGEDIVEGYITVRLAFYLGRGDSAYGIIFVGTVLWKEQFVLVNGVLFGRGDSAYGIMELELLDAYCHISTKFVSIVGILL